MKITAQTQNELTLQEGSASGLFVGAVFLVGGVIAAVLKHAASPVFLWGGLAAALVGVIIICVSSSITVNANRSTGQLSYQKKRLIGTQNDTYAIADVLRIETRKQWRMENGARPENTATPQQPMLVAQSVIVFKTGKELALDHQKTSSTTQVGSAVLMSGQAKESAIANQVAEFLGVPFLEIMPPNMSSGVNINMGGGAIRF